jgi:hypothetical protein
MSFRITIDNMNSNWPGHKALSSPMSPGFAAKEQESQVDQYIYRKNLKLTRYRLMTDLDNQACADASKDRSIERGPNEILEPNSTPLEPPYDVLVPIRMKESNASVDDQISRNLNQWPQYGNYHNMIMIAPLKISHLSIHCFKPVFVDQSLVATKEEVEELR